jgi:probable F420-dependent oxidoreductase
MDIGVFQVKQDSGSDPAVTAKRAEELGFESYWAPDHTIIPVESSESYPGGAPDADPPEYLHQLADPLIALARASGATSTIKLGTGVLLVPERNPLLMAKQIATLDDACGGRFLFGIGAGWNREECEILGGDFDHRWTQVRESIGIMKDLWTQDQSRHEGRYYNFPAVKCFPKPAQKPHPPIFLGGVSAERVFNRVVDYGDGWMPLVETADDLAAGVERLKRVCDDKGRDFATLDITAFGLDGQWRAADDVAALEKAGANRLVIWLQAMATDGILAELEQLAAELIVQPAVAARI